MLLGLKSLQIPIPFQNTQNCIFFAVMFAFFLHEARIDYFLCYVYFLEINTYFNFNILILWKLSQSQKIFLLDFN